MELFGTLGPGCSDRETLIRMFGEGMTGIRLNMSHTGLREAAGMLRTYREAAQAAGCPGADLLIDLQGPELRIGALSAPLELQEGDPAVLAGPDICEQGPAGGSGSGAMIPVSRLILDAMQPGDRVLLDDGRLCLKVLSESDPAGSVRAQVIRGGVLQSRKSLKIEGRSISTPTLTAMDVENLRAARDMGVTAVMQPFVRSGEDLRTLKRAMADCGAGELRVVAKIENREGVSHIRDILPEADMIVIARGDLGNDMPLWELPAVQKELSAVCREAWSPFLVVTQLLTSMIGSAVPTRAEVSDIFNAVADGASAVMLTNETAAGRYPAEAVRYLKKTCDEAQKWLSRA